VRNSPVIEQHLNRLRDLPHYDLLSCRQVGRPRSRPCSICGIE
jgi:hypothetical protein